MDRSDTGWQRTEGAWDRLRWARQAGGFANAKDFADAVGMPEGTYRAYERSPDSSKHTKLNGQLAIRFARRLKVRWQWLLANDGTPWDEEVLLGLGDRVRSVLQSDLERGDLEEEDVEQIASLTELLKKKRTGANR